MTDAKNHDAPNPEDFSRDEREGEYVVRIEMCGVVEMTIRADDDAGARAEAERMIDARDVEMRAEDAKAESATRGDRPQ